MTTSRPMRGLAVLATGALLWGLAAGPASADSIHDDEWVLQKYGVASSVWPISQGDGVIVAVIDSGVAEVPDLKGQLLEGADFPETNAHGRDDTDGHGTGMASDIAAHGHDGGQAGVVGLAPKAKILPIRADLPSGQESLNNVASAIRYAVDHGAKVINMSFGTPGLGGPSVERDAVNYAISKDVVLVAAVGNTHGAAVTYPAAFPGVVAVNGIDQDGNYWDHSGRGPETTLVAPAVGIVHADPTVSSGYAKADGTSESSAFVAAIAALVRSKYPELSAGQVINRMIQSAVAPPDKSTVPNDRYGYGIASPSRALQPNPAVDNGPKDNPLLKRVESQAEPGSNSSSTASSGAAAAPTGNTAASKTSGGSKAMLFAVGGGVLVLVIIVIVVLVSRRSRNGGGNGGHGGGPGGSGGGYPYAPQGQPGPQGYQQQYPPQGYPQQQYPPQQPPQPPQGNPYQR